jgi:hypothetical protein
MNPTFRQYAILLGVSAVILTAIIGFFPAIIALPVPTFVYLFIPSLAFDMYNLPKINNGDIPPLTGMDRGLGMVTAALFHIMLTKFLFG